MSYNKKQLIDFSDYNEAIDLMLQYVNRRDDIVTLWQYGKVTEPGVSDIDFIAVVSDNPNKDLSTYLNRNNFDSKVLAAINKANLIVVPEKKSLEVFLWDKLNIIDLSSMNKINEDSVIKGRQGYRDVAMLVDWVFILIYRFFSDRHRLKINDRTALARMKSFGYTVNLFRSLGGRVDDDHFSHLSGKLSDLRKNWLTIGEKERKKLIDALYTEYVDFVAHFHKSVFYFFSDCSYYPDGNNLKDVELIWPKSCGQFVFVDTFVDTIDKVAIPTSLLTHFYLYSSDNSELAKRIKKSFNVDFDIHYRENDYYSFLSERIESASVWFDYLRNNNFSSGLFKMGWYL